MEVKPTTRLLDQNNILHNSCIINKDLEFEFVANIGESNNIIVAEQSALPYAIFECKRVGRDGKGNRGPQAIEKAKQGSYVARTVSSLQKIRNNKGKLMGIMYDDKNKHKIESHSKLFEEIIKSDDMSYLSKFIMIVGIVSNHGNWFNSNNLNKELKVLSQSYDWLLFLTDMEVVVIHAQNGFI